jgi:phosphoribosylanthranilate isomerase
MRTRVKICGITRAEDAAICVEAGVDALGFNFWPGSKRHVQPEQARDIAAALPPGVLRVGVFVHAAPAEVREVVRRVGLGAVQLHGDEDPADYRDVVVAYRNGSGWNGRCPGRRPHTPMRSCSTRGSRASAAAAAVRLEVGQRGAGLEPTAVARRGLDPLNVGDAIRTARPWGVDVASGVESAPGKKEPGKVRAFVTAVRAVEDAP